MLRGLRLKSNGRFAAVSGSEVLDLMIEAVCLAVIFLLPIWFAYLFPTYNIFEFNKISLFRVLVLLLLLLTGLKLVFFWPAYFGAGTRKPWVRLVRKYWLVPLVLIAGLALSLIFSIDPVRSFYGSYDWQAGWLSYFFCFLWLVLLSFNLIASDRRHGEAVLSAKINRLVVTAALSGLIVSVYSCLQALGIDFIHWADEAWEGGRVTSSFGQPNFLASFLLLIIPLNFYLISQARIFPKKLFWSFAALFSLAALIFTASRGALLALLIAAALFFLIFLWRSELGRRKKAAIIIAGLAVAALLFLLLEAFSPGRFQSLFDYQSGSVAARLNFYQAAVDAISQRPLTGYGLENGPEIFIQYYEPDWGVYGDAGASTGQAHNLVLDILLTTGLIGLALFSSFYYFFFSLAWRRRQGKVVPILNQALVFGATAYLLSLLFSFPTSAGEIYFWSFLALLVAIDHSSDRIIQFSPGVPSGRSKGGLAAVTTLGLLLIIFCVYLISWQFRSWRADYYFDKLYYSLGEGDYLSALVLSDYLEAESPTPNNQEYYDWFLAEKLSDFYPNISDLAAKGIVAGKLKELSSRLDDQGYRDLLAQGEIQGSLGNSVKAGECFDRLTKLTPHWPKAYIAQAQALERTGDLKGAAVSYYLAILNLPRLSDSRLNDRHYQVAAQYLAFINRNLGDVCQRRNDFVGAERHYQAAYRSWPSDFTILKKIADTYYLRGDLAGAIEYNQYGWKRNPVDYHWPLAVALLYQAAEQESAWAGGEAEVRIEAEKYYEMARQLAPIGLLPAKLDEYGK